MPSQTIPAAGANVNTKALFSGKHSVHGDSQHKRQAHDNSASYGDEAEQAANEAAELESKSHKKQADKANGDTGPSSFEKLFDLVSPDANKKAATTIAAEASSEQSAEKADFKSVQQLLAQAGFGQAPDKTGSSAQTGANTDPLLQAGKGQLPEQALSDAALAGKQHNGTAGSMGKVEARAAKDAKALFQGLSQPPEKVSLGSMEQLAKSAQSNPVDPTNLKAFSLDTRATSAFDTVMPIVRDAMLTPTQKAQRDGFSVLKQETHFAPMDMLETNGVVSPQTGLTTANSVLRQIGDALSGSLNGQGSANPDSALDGQFSSGLKLHRSGDVLRVLDIQLHPADLGKVRLSVRLNDNNIEVRIEASKAETAKMLETNQHELNKLLQKAGYQADRIAVVAMDEKGPSQILPPSSSDSLNQQNGQDRSGSSGANNGSGDQGGQKQQSGARDEGGLFSMESFDDNSDGVHHEATNESQPYRGLTL
ncbi:flagellar hook-length control protein FliK [uncultured Cohaesibacter sp.]|uniref:flagellar hook-length control protein FliK n=1 Tax=uncultured Cohaesibacter sp. TaxID=1002546 RepID=UPI002AAB02D7|nr:flagellar hook-length control protein FliK [uncultured Cohaesibacter sp.]